MYLIKNRRINKNLINAIVCLSVFLACYSIVCCSGGVQREKQKRILSKLKRLTANELSLVELQFVKKSRLTDQSCTLTGADLHKFISFFDDADFMQVGGHNRRKYEGIIIINYKNGDKEKYVGTVYSDYDFNRDALYIYDYFFRKKNGYYLEKESGLPIRVPMLGKWISTKCPFGKI